MSICQVLIKLKLLLEDITVMLLGVQNFLTGPQNGQLHYMLLVILTMIVGNVTALILIVSHVSCSSLSHYSLRANDRAEVITAHRPTSWHPCGSAAVN